MLVGKIKDGVVIDHISAGKGLLILKLLNPEPDAKFVVASNVSSNRYGRKDLLKIEGEYITSSQVDVIGLISPNATVDIIGDHTVKEKHSVRAPAEVLRLIDCKNPNCASKGQLSRFSVRLLDPIEHTYFVCSGCGAKIFYDEAVQQLLAKVSSGVLISRRKIQRELLDLLIKKGGIRLNGSFKLKSGRISPYFVNLGALNDGESLSKLRWIMAGFSSLLLTERMLKDFDFIFGPAYKGINLAALTCEGLNEYIGSNKRYLYDRKEPKLYGDVKMDKEIVGAEYFKSGQKVLVVDDTMTTGETKVDSVKKLSSLGDHEVVGMIVCVDRQEKSLEGDSAIQDVKRTLGIDVFPILTAEAIYDMVKGMLSEQERAAWIDYYRSYGSIRLA